MSLKIVHVISGSDTGGAEVTLYKLLSNWDRGAFSAEVICLTGLGVLGKKMQAEGYVVRSLNMQRGIPSPLKAMALVSWLRHSKADLIQTWMYHSDLLGGLAAKMLRRTPVIWGIRTGPLDVKKCKRTTILTVRACARLSRSLPSRIVSCSEKARQLHARLGYPLEKMVVIPNGYDLATFKPDPAARVAVRRELGVHESGTLVGLVARFDPQKDHGTFVRASALLASRCPGVHFLLCGDGISNDNQELSGWITEFGLGPRFHLLNRRENVARVMAALDIASLSSAYGEAFPNVVGEAMACGVPCVVTEVGDAPWIVGDTGRVVPICDPAALAAAWEELVRLGAEERIRLGLAARRRVAERFNLPAVVARYEGLYQEVRSQAQS